jgi:hypothetical protein
MSMTVNCVFHSFNWCEFVKHRCHYADSETDYPEGKQRKRQAKQPCPWAQRYAASHHIVTPFDAEELAKKLSKYGAPERQVRDARSRLCIDCEQSIGPMKDDDAHKTYTQTGQCQACQDKCGSTPLQGILNVGTTTSEQQNRGQESQP